MLYGIKISALSLLLLITYVSASNAGIIFSESFETDGLNQRYNSTQEGTFNGPRTARDWHWQRQSANQSGDTSFYAVLLLKKVRYSKSALLKIK
jgi:hypothetical protein